MTQSLLNSVGLILLGAVVSFISARYWFIRNAQVKMAEQVAAAADRLQARVTELEREHALVKAAVVPITTAFQAILIKELTHFHTPVMDALMVKIGPPNVLTDEEEAELITALKQRTEDLSAEISDSEREAATILPIVMKRAKIEQEQIANESVLLVVAVPKQDATESAEPSDDPGSS